MPAENLIQLDWAKAIAPPSPLPWPEVQALSLQKGTWRGRSWEGEKAVPGRLPRVGFMTLVQERHMVWARQGVDPL